jgi:cold shock protein
MLAAWETIRKFVLERGRDFRQRRRRVVEEDSFDQLPSNSDVPLQFAEPQFEEPSGVAVQGKVKWFNPSKGYGFVELSEGSGDAFLHASVLGRIGISAVQPGETLELPGGSGAARSAGDRGHQCGQQHRGPVQTAASEF